MSLQQSLSERTAAHSPAAFRKLLRISPDSDASLDTLLQPWQHADFTALDPAWQLLARVARPEQREGRGERGPAPHAHHFVLGVPPIRGADIPVCQARPNDAGSQHTLAADRNVCPTYWRAYIERPRGHAKTSDMAAQLCWILQFARRPVRGLAAAADRDQAGLIRDAMELLGRLNPKLCSGLDYQKNLVINHRTGSRLDIITSDVQSSWGALPDFVICDELCHWEKPDLWQSLFSSAAKKPHCLLAVLTNAGVGRGWQWELREAARQDPAWHFSSLAEPQAPWITPNNLAEQRRLLPAAVFDRLWRNLWQETGGEFVTLVEAEACRDESLSIKSRGEPHRRYIAAVDYAEKHDFTVGVVVHREGRRLIVDRMDVAVPREGAPVKVAWVEAWIERIAAAFPPVTFVLDEYQLLGTIQRLEARHDLRRFEFLGGAGNHALALNLRQLIIHRDVRWYPHCGAIDEGCDEHSAMTPVADDSRLATGLPLRARNDLETELASLVLEQTAAGRCRIDHINDGVHHDDRAFALGAACLHALQDTGEDFLHIGGTFSPP